VCVSFSLCSNGSHILVWPVVSQSVRASQTPLSLSMYLAIRAFAFTCLVGLSLILPTDAACGTMGQMEFNTPGTNLPQGQDGELFCAVKCILRHEYCQTNYNGDKVYPALAQGTSQSDSGPLMAYYGPSISNWCVGQVKDFSSLFENEVSNVLRITMAKAEFSCTSYFCRSIQGHLQPAAAVEHDECDRHELHV
jgi:hypothetical protein